MNLSVATFVGTPTLTAVSAALALGLAASSILGCGGSGVEGSGSFLGATQAALDETEATGDGSAALVVRKGGLSLRFEPSLSAKEADQGPRFTLSVSGSVPLSGAIAYDHEGTLGTVRPDGQDAFAIDLNASEVTPLAAGAPLFLEVEVTGGETFWAYVSIGAQFTPLEGQNALDFVVQPEINGVAVAGEPLYRGYFSLAQGLTNPTVSTTPATIPGLEETSQNRWRLQYSVARLVQAAVTGEALTLSASRGATELVSANTSVRFYVASAAITDIEAATEWPKPSCTNAVWDCLGSVEGGASGDTEGCGSAYEVSQCRLGGPSTTPSLGTDPYAGIEEHFPVALAGYLEQKYEAEGESISAGGGQLLANAIAAIDAELIEPVTDPALHPFDIDLEQMLLVRHPDVIFPGSEDYHWGIYDRGTGQLFSVETY
jgi:hypothetical protein